MYGWRRFARDVAADTVVCLGALAVGHVLTQPRSADISDTLGTVIRESPILVPVVLGFLFWRGVYNANPRYFGLTDFLGIAITGLIATLTEFVLPFGAMEDPRLAATRALVFGAGLTAGISWIRIFLRVRSWRRLKGGDDKSRATLIVGAGDAGDMIMHEINRSTHRNHRVIGFVDDDPAKASLAIDRVPVLGTTDQIPDLVKEHKIENIFIAIPSANGSDMRRILELCQETNARVKTLPSVHELVNGGAQMSSHLREVEIEDLLRREPVRTDVASISRYLGGERVLITGGGGSIGAELARQIAGMSPASLVLLGKGENSIYEIEQELIQVHGFQPTSVIADVRDREAMEAAFATHRPTVVFHAAAHKHVPLMQGNPIEAIRNNVLGTWQVAEVATKYGARRLIYVSTDKAVHPSSVMGATKRVGEMLIASYGRRTETECGIVRFGNVLGSRGSVIPILKSQIRRGGPVRLTHPEMTRYFMTIPEAVQLILQAGVLAGKGEVFLLDMGEPVRVVDLAEDLIRLHGLMPGSDIEIQFTGVRPGEKLHEELLYDSEHLDETAHPKISMVRNAPVVEWSMLKAEVVGLLDLCAAGQAEEARHSLMELAWGKSVSSTFSVSN